MTEVTYQTASSGADFSNTGNNTGGHSLTFQHARVWSNDSGLAADIWDTFLIFVTDGSGPTKGAVINSAKLELTASASTNDDVLCDVLRIQNVGTSFTSSTTRDSFTLVGTPIELSQDDIDDTAGVFTQFDITQLVQDAVNEDSWQAGNRIGLALLGKATADKTLNIRTYDNGASYGPRLVIDWSAVSVDAGSDATIDTGEPYTLTASGTGTTTITWSIQSKPSTSNATLAVSANPGSFRGDRAGEYVLRATDTSGAYDEVTITCLGAPVFVRESGEWKLAHAKTYDADSDTWG